MVDSTIRTRWELFDKGCLGLDIASNDAMTQTASDMGASKMRLTYLSNSQTLVNMSCMTEGQSNVVNEYFRRLKENRETKRTVSYRYEEFIRISGVPTMIEDLNDFVNDLLKVIINIYTHTGTSIGSSTLFEAANIHRHNNEIYISLQCTKTARELFI